MARVALVQCPAWGTLPPLGPAALKAYLVQHGHEARCFDLNIEFFLRQQHAATYAPSEAAYGDADPWGSASFAQWSLDQRSVVDIVWASDDDQPVRFSEGSMFNDRPLPIAEWADQVLAFEPRIVGFTIYLTSLASSLQLAREIRRRDPSVLLVFGGPQVARDQEGDVALRSSIPDLVADGEGEATLLAIAEAVDAGEDTTQIVGTGRLANGEPVWQPVRPLIPKVDSLPYPDFSDVDWSLYPNPYLVPIMASRGCVLKCAFCYETVYWKRFRTQSPERIVGEIEHQVSHHPLREQAARDGKRIYFMFADSLVNGHPAGLRRTAQLLIDRGVEVGWGGQATINTKMDEAFFQTLHRSGCTGLAFGLESGSQRVLETMGKHFHIDDAADFMRQVHDAGVTVTVNVMVGFPTETRRDFFETLKFLRRTRKWIYQVSNVTTTQVALGSDLYVNPDKYGVVTFSDGSWESPDTGTEKDRRRRLQVLHLWMKLWRIPHQNISPV